MFTIEAKKREKDEEFNFEDVIKNANVVHDNCYRGKTEIKFVEGEDDDYWFFYCGRCDAEEKIDQSDEGEMKLKIIQTAIDGEERQLSDDVRVIQKT